MPNPTEHKTVQARILQYAQDIGWIYVPRAEAEKRRGFSPHEDPHPNPLPEGEGIKREAREAADRAQGAFLYFGDLLHSQVLAFNPKYKEAEGALVGEFQRLNSDIRGNRDFLAYLRNQGKFFCSEENRELDLTLIDYNDLTRQPTQWRNVYEVTEEFYVLSEENRELDLTLIDYNDLTRQPTQWRNVYEVTEEFYVLNKILDRAVNLKNFLKGKDRVEKVAQTVADHYQANVEPLGYKAFLVAVDREACALYKEALDKILPLEYSEIVFTGNNNDPAPLKKWHLDIKKERQVRKNFTRIGEWPKILIVTEKLLTGFDAPILYAMYLDKPMRDHTLLQAIARVNRPYENEAEEMVKPHGFVLDFVGIFDKLEKALAFDSDEINAIVKDLGLLKHLFKAKMETKAPAYLALVTTKFDDRDVDSLIEHFRDKERRKEFFKEYKEVEMLYEIISPDAFLRPFLDDYATLSSMYSVVRNAYAKRVYADRAFQRKTNELVQKHIGTTMISDPGGEYVAIDKATIDTIKQKEEGKATRVINLIKSIERTAEDNSEDPFLVAMAERARAVQEGFEDRQITTADALTALLREIEKNQQRKKEQAARGLNSLTYFVLCKLTDDGIPNPEAVSRKVAEAFAEFPNWRGSDAELRELRKQVTFALCAEEENLEKVASSVEALFTLLQKSFRP